nr:reverse transcriptase domain-containing protein [Tanacetum cinerariifolium]
MEKFKIPPHYPPVIVIDPDDQPMWSSTRTIAPTPSSAIIQLPISTNFCVKGTYMQMIRDSQFDGRIPSNPHRHIDDFLEISSLFQYGGNQKGSGEAGGRRGSGKATDSEVGSWWPAMVGRQGGEAGRLLPGSRRGRGSEASRCEAGGGEAGAAVGEGVGCRGWRPAGWVGGAEDESGGAGRQGGGGDEGDGRPVDDGGAGTRPW